MTLDGGINDGLKSELYKRFVFKETRFDNECKGVELAMITGETVDKTKRMDVNNDVGKNERTME